MNKKFSEKERLFQEKLEKANSDPKIEMIKQREKQLKTALAKLLHAEQASEVIIQLREFFFFCLIHFYTITECFNLYDLYEHFRKAYAHELRSCLL